MSTYTKYNEVSSNYDSCRVATGVDYYLGACLLHHSVPLSEMHVLDAGCGTGNYSRALLDKGIGQVSAFDGSEGMLKVAKAKLRHELETGRVKTIQQHYLPEMPFKDSEFDVVMINQVLHHLQQNCNGEDFPTVERALEEADRVLKPGGILIISDCLPHQITSGFWYYKLIPSAAERMAKKHPPHHLYKKTLSKLGFTDMHTIVPLYETYNTSHYHDVTGPLNPEWRDTDSFWSITTEEEIKEMEQYVKSMQNNNTLEEFVNKSDEDRLTIGQYTIIYAQKPLTTVSNGYTNGHSS